MKTVYTNLYEINLVQQTIIRYVKYWASTEKEPVPRKNIMEEMIRKGKKKATIAHNLDGLVRLGYLRRAEGTSNKTRYVLLRTI